MSVSYSEEALALVSRSWAIDGQAVSEYRIAQQSTRDTSTDAEADNSMEC